MYVLWHASKFKFATKIEFDEPSKYIWVALCKVVCVYVHLESMSAKKNNTKKTKQTAKKNTEKFAKN